MNSMTEQDLQWVLNGVNQNLMAGGTPAEILAYKQYDDCHIITLSAHHNWDGNESGEIIVETEEEDPMFGGMWYNDAEEFPWRLTAIVFAPGKHSAWIFKSYE